MSYRDKNTVLVVLLAGFIGLFVGGFMGTTLYILQSGLNILHPAEIAVYVVGVVAFVIASTTARIRNRNMDIFKMVVIFQGLVLAFIASPGIFEILDTGFVPRDTHAAQMHELFTAAIPYIIHLAVIGGALVFFLPFFTVPPAEYNSMSR